MSQIAHDAGLISEPLLSPSTPHLRTSSPAVPAPATPASGTPRSSTTVHNHNASQTAVPLSSPATSPKSQSRVKFWAVETGLALLLLLCIAAIPATLYPHQGQPLPRWPFSITINALLSIYSMVLKACMAGLVTSCVSQLQWSWYLRARPLQDITLFRALASDAFGSATWLWKYPVQQPLATLAACIVIVSIAVDPFLQQLVQPVNCNAAVSGNASASVPRTNYLQHQDLPSSLEQAVLGGLFTYPNLTDFDCPTGNCTFSETYSTVAFCSQCIDTSADVVINESCLVDVFHTNGSVTTTSGPCNADSRDELTGLWNITTTSSPTPHVFSIQAQKQYEDVLSFNYPTPVLRGEKFGAILGYSDSAIFGTDPANGLEALSGCDNPATNDTWRCKGYGAAECSLQPCIKTYSCSIEAGIVNETVVEQTSFDQLWGFGEPGTTLNGLDVDEQLFGLVDMNCITDYDRQNLTLAGYATTQASRWLPYNITFDPSTAIVNSSSAFPQSLLAQDCLYIIDTYFPLHLAEDTLSSLLVGSVTRSLDESGTSSFEYTFAGTQQLVQLYDSGNVSLDTIESTFVNLAQALTLWTRQNGASNYSHRAAGNVLHYAVCVQVHWAWISLPAALAGLVLVLFALTIVITAQQKAPMWKDSALPLLLYGPAGRDWVDEDLIRNKKQGAAFLPDGSVGSMKTYASSISLKLLQHDGHYELRQAAGS
ncbi:hypothetical protein BD289DRAFT_375948 [Coniella lustricola]|uniref:Uncharacterized protein n=1 Tax=Coniella lustricola TaxID=2025994 RepID=A0A2T2ZXN5_9PEZI|nr:hypothetical protein BD289DRAFT_375948 [Coniella lustricola]